MRPGRYSSGNAGQKPEQGQRRKVSLVLAGSVGKAVARPSLPASVLRRRLDLVEQGVVDIRGDDYVFVRDQLFSSPSTAGAVVLGGSINGRITWKTATGRTFQQLEDEALNDDSPRQPSVA